MIPLHRPPFGLAPVLAAAISSAARNQLARVEAAYAEFAGLHAIWLPSARAGIDWSLRAATTAETQVLAPAFTCSVVHELLIAAGHRVRWFEPDSDELLVSTATLAPQQTSPQALILCELYGHTYDLAQLTRQSVAPPVIRVVDMAMAVPHASLFARLEERDFAVISFGTGKNMYAGWGAMGFARNAALAAEVRKIRDASLVPQAGKLAVRRALDAAARVVGNKPLIHAVARKFRDHLPRPRRPSNQAPAEGAANVGRPDLARTPEWKQPSTKVDRALALWNLRHAAEARAARVNLAARYQQRLVNASGIRCPRATGDALSHFTVRIGAGIRNRVKERLYAKGINTVTLWAFSARLNAVDFPHTSRTCDEVLNLPLAPWMTTNQVDFVCESLMRCVAEAGQDSPSA